MCSVFQAWLFPIDCYPVISKVWKNFNSSRFSLHSGSRAKSPVGFCTWCLEFKVWLGPASGLGSMSVGYVQLWLQGLMTTIQHPWSTITCQALLFRVWHPCLCSGFGTGSPWGPGSAPGSMSLGLWSALREWSGTQSRVQNPGFGS